MKTKTSELTGAALDWAVAKCAGVAVEYIDDGITQCLLTAPYGRYAPSTDWSQGGPIIEREGITLTYQGERWAAQTADDLFAYGTTPLIAAMRCYVASKLGDEVEVPKELK
jgi:hypothetical protein